MKQVDQDPAEYRRRDPETGEMKPPVNKMLCRWGAVVCFIFVVWFAFYAHWYGESFMMVLAPGIMGAAGGWLGALSLRRPEW